MFPPIHRKFAPEFTDFNYWREAIPDIPIPDLSPPSPALSARSDGSGRLSVLRNLTTGIGRRASRQSVASSPGIQPTKHTTYFSSRPSSPLVGPALTAGPDTDILSEDEDFWDDRRTRQGSGSMPGSLPGSFDDRADYLADDYFDRKDERSGGDYDQLNHEEQYEAAGTPDAAMDQQSDEDDDELGMFEEDLEQMSKVPF
jgi:phosphatidate phosphatase LPIN